jgi:hypothetical protein
MTDDLVKRLRAIDKDIILRRFDPEMSFDGMTAHKAADRIEKLEAALRSYVCNCTTEICDDCLTSTECGYRARKALDAK